MKEETTGRLESVLKDVDSLEEAKAFSAEHAKEPRFFYEYINSYIASHQLDIKPIIDNSGVSRNYIYNILNGDKKHPGRDKVIAICIAAGMSLDEVNRGLRISGHNSLYPKNARDIHIATLINAGIQNVTQINIALLSSGIEILNV